MAINTLSNVEDLGPEYKLSWPPSIFISEVSSIINQEVEDDLWAIGSHLLQEAFEDDQVHRAFDKAASEVQDSFTITHMKPRKYLVFLRNNAEELHDRPERGAYWLERRGVITREIPSSFQNEWVSLIEELISHGYFTKNAPFPDRSEGEVDDVHLKLDILARQKLGIDVMDLWSSARSKPLDEDYLYALLELFHDLVARPRLRTPSEVNDQIWNFSHQATTTGQEIYRWKVNALLGKHRTGFELSNSGENLGRLVRVVSDPRASIAARVVVTNETDTADSIEHAIALFEKRNASRDEKRSACVALARIFEARRPLIKDQLLNKDEGLLFRLANEFDIRHGNEKQNADYDDDFLDWIFWVFLSTTELTNRLMARQA